jgi:ABC-type oligopeptide transport system ATPase subunit
MTANISKKARLFSQMSDAERLAHLGGFQADTPQFLEAKQAMLRLYRGWQTTRDAHILTLCGDSGVGKTTVADDVIQQLESEWQGIVANSDNKLCEPTLPIPATAGITKESPTGLIRPVVKVFVEPKARARGVLRDTLHALGVRSTTHDTYGELMEKLQIHVVGQQVRLLIFDEVHHVVEGHGPATAYEAVEVIKMLLLQARVQIACIGLPITESILDKNPELPRHCRGKIEMTPLTGDFSARSDFMRFLKALSRDLPFDVPSNLSEVDIALRIHVATTGLIGEIINLVHAACEVAIDCGLERINRTLLAEVYGRINGGGPANNPFAAEVLSQEAISSIRKRKEDRRHVSSQKAALPAQKPSNSKPSFKK